MDADDSAKLSEDLQTLLPVIVEDIERAKQWQWALFVQVLTGQAALGTLSSFLPAELKGAWIGALILALSAGLLWLGVRLILQTRDSLERARTRNAALRTLFHPRLQEILGTPTEKDKHKFHSYMIVILAIAALFAWAITFVTMVCPQLQ